jgi:hypothetical protein
MELRNGNIAKLLEIATNVKTTNLSDENKIKLSSNRY